jgi:regulator of replication initiation timing
MLKCFNMKYWKPLFLALMAGCTPGADHTQHQDTPTGDSTNVVLYNEVMDIHDEVMPKMEDLYNMKKDIQERLKDPSGLAAAEQERLKTRLAQIDSVSKMMMDWMHEFNPPPDTTDKEEARAYFERELEKVKQVKQAMLETIEQGNDQK